MSYDVDIGDESFNYTYNLSRFFHEHVVEGDRTGIQALGGMTGAQGAAIIEKALVRIESTRGRLGPDGLREAYDPINRWGNTTSATEFLRDMSAAFARHPEETITAS